MSINPKYSNFISVLEKNNNYNQNYLQNEKCICNTSSDDSSELINNKTLSKQQKNKNSLENKQTVKSVKKTITPKNIDNRSDSLISTDIDEQIENKPKKYKDSSSLNSNSLENNIKQKSKQLVKSVKSTDSSKSKKQLSVVKETTEHNTNLSSKLVNLQNNSDNILENSLEQLRELSSQSENEKIWIENKKDHDSIDSEFKELFRDKIRTKPELDSKEKQMKKLNKLFEKTVETINTKHKEKQKNQEEQITNMKKLSPDDFVKLITKQIEKNIFLNSTKGFNIQDDIYKLRFDKLKMNLTKFNIHENTNCDVGYIYRNFNNPKVYSSTNMYTNWLETTKKFNGIVSETELKPDNRFLIACLKNFTDTSKFKKKIGSYLFRAFKKTIQIYETNLIIDIIFFTKYKL